MIRVRMMLAYIDLAEPAQVRLLVGTAGTSAAERSPARPGEACGSCRSESSHR